MDLPKPNLILFDWDNTLVDTLPVIALAMKQTLGEMGLPPFTEAEQKLSMNMSLRDRFPKLFGDRWEEARDIYYGAYDSCSRDNLRELAGAGDAVRAFHGSGVPLGLVSNKRGDMLRKEVSILGWESYFVAATGAGDADEDKPSRLIYEAFLRSSGLENPKNVWMVGDSQVDMDFAVAIGGSAIFIGDSVDFLSFSSVAEFESSCSL